MGNLVEDRLLKLWHAFDEADSQWRKESHPLKRMLLYKKMKRAREIYDAAYRRELLNASQEDVRKVAE